MPQLTIGLPVYNGAKLLRRSIDSLLTQTYSDFELHLNDNASTDDTAAICQEYVGYDSRVHYFRNASTVRWNENFRIALQRAETPYFMWATHDDIWLPRFIEENLKALSTDTRAVCSVSKIEYFTPESKVIAPDTAALVGTPGERIKTFLRSVHNCGRFYGVYRTDALKRSFPEDLRTYGTDWLVVILSLLAGDHLEVGEVLLKREDQRPDHYVRSLGRIDDFKPDWLDQLLPMRRFNEELHRRLPGPVWRQILPALMYVNLRQSTQMLEHRLPAIQHVTAPLRNVVANLFHRKWRAQVSR
jgi:glycosyltransferase involved in cell wall biosynthesis